jgi:hypothetical protein
MKPTPRDPRDKHFHFHKLFGTVTVLPTDTHLDNGIFPNQNADLRPEECTAYTTTHLALQKTGKEYSHDYQFMKTLEVMGASPDSQGADARTAFKVAIAEGMLPIALEPTIMKGMSQEWVADSGNWSTLLISQTEKLSAYVPIGTDVGLDWFDGVRNGLSGGAFVGMATQWSPNFEGIGPNALLTDNPSSLYWGHMYAIVDVRSISGVPYLVAKTWQGQSYGYCYMSRALCNKLMGAWGAYAAAFMTVSGVDALKQQNVTVLEVLIALLQNLAHGVLYKVGLI